MHKNFPELKNDKRVPIKRFQKILEKEKNFNPKIPHSNNLKRHIQLWGELNLRDPARDMSIKDD